MVLVLARDGDQLLNGSSSLTGIPGPRCHGCLVLPADSPRHRRVRLALMALLVPSLGVSQTTVATFLLRFPPALGKGPLTSWLPGLRVSVSFASSLFLASTLKKSGKWKISDAHPFFSMATATLLTQTFIIFMKFLCTRRFIFLTIIHYRQL